MAIWKGTLGNDGYTAGDGDDELYGYGGIDTLYGGAGNDTLNTLGYGGDDWLDGGEGNDKLYSATGRDTLLGGNGNDYLDGGAADDRLDGGAGLDTLVGGAGNNLLLGGGDDDRLYGATGLDTLLGGDGNDYLDGASADDSLDGGAGQDSLWGGAGNNTLRGGDGNDALYTHNAPGNNLLDGGEGDDSLYAGSGTDTLAGGGGNDYLDAGSGNDSLDGGAGNDTVYGNGGHDSLDGSSGNDTLYGGTGSDTLRGGSGADRLYGDMGDRDAGNDVYYVDDLNDRLFDTGGTADVAYVSANWVYIPKDIETVIYTDGAQALPYFIARLYSGAMSDSPIGSARTIEYCFATQATAGLTGFAAYTAQQQDMVREALACYAAAAGLQFQEVADSNAVKMRFFRDDLASAGAQSAAGYASYGGAIHIKSSTTDFSKGSYGFQTLLHEIGHSLYMKHPFEAPALDPAQDTQANTVMSYHVSQPYAQNLGAFDLATLHYLYGVNAATRAGNDTYTLGEHYIWDGAGVDTLSAAGQAQAVSIDLAVGGWSWAGAKSDSVVAAGQSFIGFGTVIENATGGLGADRLSGNAAANVLDGGAGADTLAGGAGNDTYVVNAKGDVVIEQAGGGTDLVKAAISYSLVDTDGAGADGGNVERLQLTGSTAINGTGNALANVLSGNSSANVLSGGSGADTLLGGAGNDTLIGGSGQDQLTGGTGQDTFRFTDSPSAANRDLITDFSAVDDRLEFAHAAYAALGPVGTLATGAFASGTAAREADDRLLYDQARGELRYDADGTGAAAAVLIAKLGAGTLLGAADLFVV
jgi:serralysin